MRSSGLGTRSGWVVAGSALLIVLGGAAVGGDGDAPSGTAAPAGSTASPMAEPPEPDAPAAAPAEAPTAAPDAALLQQAGGGDGDSWRDTAGVEYRLGLVNAPETGECFGTEATDRRRALLADGFVADVYAQDRYGRQVAEVRTGDGRNLAVVLATEGYVDDRYLADFAHENPRLATELRPAFDAARQAGAGLWGACRGSSAPAAAAPPAPEPAAPAGSCHPAYEPCVAVKGDGSGAGDANDLDCGDVRTVVRVRSPGVDPYRLDGGGDGVGCEDWG